MALMEINMHPDIEKIIDGLIDKSAVDDLSSREIKKELLSHAVEQYTELQAQGYSEKDTHAIICSTFSNEKRLAHELGMIHGLTIPTKQLLVVGCIEWVLVSWLLFFFRMLYGELNLSLWDITRTSLIAPLSGFIVGIIGLVSPFSWTFFIVTIISICSVYYIGGIRKNLSKQYRIKSVIFIFGLALSIQWLGLFFSERSLPYISNFHPVGVGGFPFTAFQYPMPPMGSDVPPVYMWPVFYLNYGVWLIGAWLVWRLLPRRFTTYPIVIGILEISSVILTLYGLGYIVLKFD